MQEIISKIEPIISYDPASMGGDMSIIMVCEKITVTKTFGFGENPVSYPRYRVLFAKDLKGMEYSRQVVELADLISRTKTIYGKDPEIVVDCTGNEGLGDLIRSAVSGVRLCKFAGNMERETGHAGRFRTLNKSVWVQKLSLLLEQEQIIIDGEMSGANELKKQLEQFSATIRASGSVAYEAKAGHDDYVTCLLLTIAHRPGVFVWDGLPDQSPSYYTGAKPRGY